MAIEALPPTDDLTALHEEVLEFPDNFLLIDLCGEHDRNLAEIERQLGVQIVRRGNQLSVIGEKDSAVAATSTLNALYARLEAGRSVEAADVDRELRMGASEPGRCHRETSQADRPRNCP
ncbi:MAG: phosphate starvation-inducible protein PhoH, partial [Pseudomonadota bacterium]